MNYNFSEGGSETQDQIICSFFFWLGTLKKKHDFSGTWSLSALKGKARDTVN
jgi:hypothetical protein